MLCFIYYVVSCLESLCVSFKTVLIESDQSMVNSIDKSTIT